MSQRSLFGDTFPDSIDNFAYSIDNSFDSIDKSPDSIDNSTYSINKKYQVHYLGLGISCSTNIDFQFRFCRIDDIFDGESFEHFF